MRCDSFYKLQSILGGRLEIMWWMLQVERTGRRRGDSSSTVFVYIVGVVEGLRDVEMVVVWR